MTKKKVSSLEIAPITDGLDQPMKIKMIAFKPSFKLIDEVLADAKASKSDRVVNDLLSNFAQAGQVIGLSLAKLLYGALQVWPEITGVQYKNMDERRTHFIQTMFSKYGFSKSRVERYLLAWSFLDRHKNGKRLDPQVEERFLSRPIKDLIALGQNCNENGDFTKTQLDALSKTEDNGTLRKKIAQIRTGDEGNSDVMTYVLNDDGTLSVWEKNNTETIGYLSLPEDDDDPRSLKVRAIARLKRRGQIKEE